MSFGKMPLANAFIKEKEFGKEFFYEMKVGFCDELSLFQLDEHPDPSQMFNKSYPFYSGSSEYMKRHFYKYAEWIKVNYLRKDSKIIEIGSNDGTMLSNFNSKDYEYIGFEPALNVATFAKKNNINTLNQFFTYNNASLLSKFKYNTDVIYAANTICHIPDLTELIKGIDFLLSSKGVFIFEEPYLGSMFEKVSYDQIYDEHIFIFSLSAVKKIFDKFDMELIDALLQVTHGGSMRYIVSRKKKKGINSQLSIMLDKEKRDDIDNINSCIKFKNNCESSKNKLKRQIVNYKNKKKRLCGYAATSKSATVLNYCQIGPNDIDYICDTTDEKIGKFSPGMHIPIVSHQKFREDNPDIAFLFAWNHKEEIFKKERNFIKKGGKWICHVNFN